jgi:hypothetical protein
MGKFKELSMSQNFNEFGESLVAPLSDTDDFTDQEYQEYRSYQEQCGIAQMEAED